MRWVRGFHVVVAASCLVVLDGGAAAASPQSFAETLARVLPFDRALAGEKPRLLLVVGTAGDAGVAPLRDALVATGLDTELSTDEELGSRLPEANVVVFAVEPTARARDTVRGFHALSVSANPTLAEQGAVSLAVDDSQAEPEIVINMARLAEEGRSFPAALLGRARVVRESPLASELPRVLQFDTPDYPQRALRLGIEGTVILRLGVTVDGTVATVELLQGVSQTSGVDDAARRAANNARMAPARRDGQPIEGWLVLRVPFKIVSGQ